MNSVEVSFVADELTLKVKGVFDIELYNEFNDAYKEYLGTAKTYVIDFSLTERIDSAALGLMLLMRQKVGPDGNKIRIVHPNPAVTRSLNMAQFAQLFDIA